MSDPLAGLRTSKLPELIERADQLLSSLEEFASHDFGTHSDASLAPHTWGEARALAHQLAGVLSTLGFEQSGSIAVELESLMAGTQSPAPGSTTHLVELARGIVEGLAVHG